jgi:mannitol operon repressor
MGGDCHPRSHLKVFAMGKGSKKPSLHSLSRLPINMETYFKELDGESDRACALLAGAAIAEGLGDLLKRYFVKLEETDINRLFNDQRASLGDFASRTDVSFALGLINPRERLAADVIRKIRNVFAHTLAQIDFSHELIVSELRKISPGLPLPDKTIKLSFIGISMSLYIALLERRSYLRKQRSGLGGAQLPIYRLHKLSKKESLPSKD